MADWTVEPLNATVRRELLALPPDCRAAFVRISEMLIEHGPRHVGMPHVRSLGKKLYEMRLRGRDGIARAIYIAASGKRLVVVRAFVKKSQKTPQREIDLALERVREI